MGIDRRESERTRQLIVGTGPMGILRDTRRRVRQGMASKKAADRLDRIIVVLDELVLALAAKRAANAARDDDAWVVACQRINKALDDFEALGVEK